MTNDGRRRPGARELFPLVAIRCEGRVDFSAQFPFRFASGGLSPHPVYRLNCSFPVDELLSVS